MCEGQRWECAGLRFYTDGSNVVENLINHPMVQREGLIGHTARYTDHFRQQYQLLGGFS